MSCQHCHTAFSDLKAQDAGPVRVRVEGVFRGDETPFALGVTAAEGAEVGAELGAVGAPLAIAVEVFAVSEGRSAFKLGFL